MYRNKLINLLNKHTWLQFCVVILPIFIVMVYVAAYMTDMMGVASVFAYNDSITEDCFGSDEVREVTYVEEVAGMITQAIVSGDFTSDELVAVDDVIFYIQVYNIDWYQLVTGSQKSTYMESCSLFDIETDDDGNFLVSHDNISLTFEPGDLVCAVCVSPDGSWRVYFLVDEAPYYDLNELSMVELVGMEDGKYHVRVNADYELEDVNIDIDFCTNLPSDNLYYNERTNSFVKNVSKDYPYTFMLRSNILIVLLSTAMYCFLLWSVAKEDKLELLKNKHMLRANIFGVCVLPICMIFTLIMLGS